MTRSATADKDLIDLYSGRILQLAASLPHAGRLDAPDASAKRRAPLCGSSVTVDLCVQDGLITAYAQDVKACALGQAAAAILGAQILGKNHAQIERLRSQLTAMLKNDKPAPEAPFAEFEVLMPARGFANRHASILLAVEATLDALNAIPTADCA